MRNLFLFLVFVQGMALSSPSYGRDGEVGDYNLWGSSPLSVQLPGHGGLSGGREALEDSSPGGARWGTIALDPLDEAEHVEQVERIARERAEAEAKELRSQLDETLAGQKRAEEERDELRAQLEAMCMTQDQAEAEKKDLQSQLNEENGRRTNVEKKLKVMTRNFKKEQNRVAGIEGVFEGERERYKSQLEEAVRAQERLQRDVTRFKRDKAEAEERTYDRAIAAEQEVESLKKLLAKAQKDIEKLSAVAPGVKANGGRQKKNGKRRH